MTDYDWGPDLSHLDIMVDIDDVLMPTIDEIHERSRIAGLHDGSVGPEWTGWTAYGCPEQDYWDIWTQFANEGGYTTTPPVAGAVEALRRIHWLGARIHLVTARGFMAHADEIRAWTPQWVEEFAIPHASLTFARDKVAAMRQIVPQPHWTDEHRLTSSSPLSDWGLFDYAIDDSPKNTRALHQAGVRAYLLSHHHNRETTDLPRIESVGEFVDLIIEENR